MKISETDTDHKHCLDNEQIELFMDRGYLRLSNCFSREKAAEWVSHVWTRLGVSPADKSTWTVERRNIHPTISEDVRTFAPKAWAAICELLGGADKIQSCGCDDPFDNEGLLLWTDAMIMNLGSEKNEGKLVHPKDLTGWHIDGDFFRHFLDSPEQGLLVIPLFTDIDVNGGGTIIAPDSIGKIATHLYNHPEGVTPEMTPWDSTIDEDAPKISTTDFYNDLAKSCDTFIEVTGKVGDVFLLHPLMLHTGSNNASRIPRFITNPPVSLKDPFEFDRGKENEFSIVEKKTLRELGREKLPEWRPTASRKKFVPQRLVDWRMEKEREAMNVGA